MKDMKYVLGLDLGITSIGWALLGLDDDGMATHIIDANVSILDSMEDKSGKLANADRREARGARRTLRRRAYRVARVKKLFLDTFNLDLDSFYSHVRGQIQANPYTIKVKGLNELLTKEELAIALVHYAKHRGYRSNRKNDIKDSEAKVALTAISKNEKILEEKNITYSQYMINEFIENKNKYNYPKLKNSSDSKEYKYLFNRAIVKAEIEMFLDKQIEKGLINIDFKEKYIDIWSSQRDFSEGPGGNSPYSVDFAKAFGYCNFEIDGERKLRAPKCAPTTEIFTLLQKLNNIRYKSNENSDFQRLTKLELEKAVESAKNKTSIKYNDIEKIIGKKDIVFKGISLSKKDYIKVLNEYKDKNGLDKNIKISAIEHPIFKEMIEKETKKIKIFELKSFHKIKKAFKEKGASDIFDKMPIEYLDDVVTGLTFYKTDIRIKEYFSGDESNEAKISVSKLDWHIFPEVVDEIIPELDNFSDSASLSLELMRELNKELLLGLDYYEAMKKLGYDHSKAAIEVKKGKYFPSIDIIEKAYPNELTNPRVKKVLSYTMKTVNAIIKRYGSPHKINIEVARDIANGLQRRRDIENAMLDNYATNERLKQKILRDFSNKFSNFHNIKKADVEKIKLYEEQNGICMYSFEKIPYDMLFSNDLQVDHIIPYSRSFNDSFSNKTLVYTKANQEKGNKTPKEYFKNMGDDKWEKFNNYVLGNKKISKTKQSMYLADEVTDEMKSRSLNDTRFITKYLKNIIEQFLEVGNEVSFYNAKSVNILKKTYGLNRLTHSLENEKYRSYDLFRYNNYEINDKDKTITFNFVNKESKITKTIKIAAIKEKDNSPEYIKKYNISFLKVLENTDVLADILEIAEYNYTAYDLLNKVVEYPLPSDIKESFIEIFNKLHIEFDKTQIKNRDNHLHHALDAVVTAAMTNSLLVKITKFYQKIEDLKNQFYLDGRIKIEETGEDISSKDELNNYIENLWKNKYILPYEKFIEEVKYRIYEVDKEAQREKFSCEFNDGLFRNIRPITPVRFSKRKETGRLHKETIYGITNDEQTLTQRISVLKLDNKKLEKMLDKDNRAKMTYEAVKKWLNKKETEFPQLPNGRKIKKITINAGDATKAIKVKHGYASIDDVLRTDVYKSKNKEDNKLYFVQRQAFNLAQEKRGEKDFKITLWWGRDKNHKIMPFSELVDYELVSKLYKNDLVYVETKNGKGYGYVVGFSSGMFEVGSVIGDGYDLAKSQNSLFENHRLRYRITISTIEKIKKIKINMLGELSDQV